MRRISPIRTRPGDDPALQELKTSLQDTQSALAHAYANFNCTSDPELTDACIFEIRSLQSRMNYLLRQIKEQEALPAAGKGGQVTWI